MNNARLSILFLIWFTAVVQLCAQSNEIDLPKVIHYGLTTQFFLKDNRVRVEAALTIRNTTRKSLQQIPVLLYRLLSVQRVTDGTGAPAEFSQNISQFSDEPSLQVNAVVVTLPTPLMPNDTVKMVISYDGYIFGYPEVMAYAQDKIDETYSLFRPDALAYPMLASASFDSYRKAYDTKFTYEIHATVPKSYTAVCGGELISSAPAGPDSTLFVFHSKIPTWRMDLAVARFNLLRDIQSKLSVYHLAEDSAGARRVLEASGKVIGFYHGLFGWPKRFYGYTVIEIPDGWGSQASDFYFLQTAAAFQDSARINEVYHEIGHTWNAKAAESIARCRYFDEAFACYFEALALKEFYGQDAFLKRVNEYRHKFAERCKRDKSNGDSPIASYGAKDLGGNSYTKGAWSLYVLNEVVGDSIFDHIIRSLLADFADTGVDFHAFQALAERNANRDLKKFFDEWIYGIESSRLMNDGTPIETIVKRYRER